MMKREWARLLQSICTTLTLMIVAFDLPKWAVIAAMIPAVVLLIDCIIVVAEGGRTV